MAQPEWRAAAGLDAASRVLLINTEGATAPGVYAELVGRSAEAVLGAQQAWLGGHGIERIDSCSGSTSTPRLAIAGSSASKRSSLQSDATVAALSRAGCTTC